MDHSGNSENNVSSTKPLEALEYPYQVFLISLYSFTACFAFISNLLTIVVMVKGKRCSRDLRKFLINLSVTDLLMAVFTIPFTYTNYMLGRWIFFPFMCPIVNCAQLTTITVSIYTLVAIAIDRYVAIMHPLKKSISWFKQHRTLIVILIWIVGLLLGLSQLIVSETNTFIHDGREYLSCGERWTPESTEGRLYTAFIFSTTFALPISALCIIYTAMGWKMFRYQGPQQQQQQQQQQCDRNKKRPEYCQNHNHHHHHHCNHHHHLSSPKSSTKFYQQSRKTRGPEEAKLMFSKTIRQSESECCKSVGDDERSASSAIVDDQPPEVMAANQEVDLNHSTHSVCYKSLHVGTTNKQDPNKLKCNNSHNNNNNNNNNDQKSSSTNNSSSYCNYDYDSQGNRVQSINQRSWKLMHIRRNKVLKMLITIIGVFTICWLPIQMFNILIYFMPNFLKVDSEFKYYAFVGSYFFCHWISMAHSFMNPIIYSFMSKNFRSDMKMIFSNFRYHCLWRKTFGTLGRESTMNEIHYGKHHHYYQKQDKRQTNYNNKINNNNKQFGFTKSYYYPEDQKQPTTPQQQQQQQKQPQNNQFYRLEPNGAVTTAIENISNNKDNHHLSKNSAKKGTTNNKCNDKIKDLVIIANDTNHSNNHHSSDLKNII